MKIFWSVMRYEFILQLRSKTIWFLIAVMIFLGGFEVFGIRRQPENAWENTLLCFVFLTIILVFFSGNQIHRDRERHLDGIIWSTSVSTTTYIWGKYLSVLLFGLALTLISVVAAIIIDQLPDLSFLPVYGPFNFSPLGAQFYLILWLWFVIIPVVFGSALTLIIITLIRGQRIIAYILALFLWFASLATGFPRVIDITSTNFVNYGGNSIPYYAKIVELVGQVYNGPLSSNQQMHIMDLLRSGFPPTWLPITFIVNRLIFLILAVIFMWITVAIVNWQRQRSA